MHSRHEHRQERAQWVFCLTAVGQLVERLPLLFRLVEAGDDDVRVELHMKSSTWEILELGQVDRDHVAVGLSGQLEATRASSVEAWMGDGIGALDADLQWAASRPCSEQADELLSALVRIRGTLLRGDVK
jgi:hypothetical protein